MLHFGGGSHGPIYADRHPPEFQKFKPMCNDADVANRCTPEEVYNSYDNTILYVDHVLSEAIQRLDESGVPYVFIYLSDHGESLMEDGMMFHGMPPASPARGAGRDSADREVLGADLGSSGAPNTVSRMCSIRSSTCFHPDAVGGSESELREAGRRSGACGESKLR